MYKTARQRAHLARVISKPEPTQLELFNDKHSMSPSAYKALAIAVVVGFTLGFIVAI